jgi:hypothetical protein
LAALVLTGCGASERDAPSEMGAISPVLGIVREHMEAFNRHDVEAMAARVAPDFVWFGVAGEEVTVEARGRAALADGMRSYFAALPSVRSEIEESVVSGSFVAIRERATWTDASGAQRTQASLGIYEIRDGLIQRVWYYPAEG